MTGKIYNKYTFYSSTFFVYSTFATTLGFMHGAIAMYEMKTDNLEPTLKMVELSIFSWEYIYIYIIGYLK